MAWREDDRRKPNGMLYLLAAGADLGHPVSPQWNRYWQRNNIRNYVGKWIQNYSEVK